MTDLRTPDAVAASAPATQPRVEGFSADRSSRGAAQVAARWLGPLAVVLVTLAAFLPSLRNGFVAWDDTAAFLANPYYRGLGPTQLGWMWTSFHAAMYRPLTWMTYGADFTLWGLEPSGYHLTSLLVHTANALLVYLLARRLLAAATPAVAKDPALSISAAVAALLFAIHPLRVEVVAWASARGDVLSTSFLLLSALAYLRRSTRPEGRGRWLAASVLFYALSLLAKPVALTFPIVLLALDIYPLRRLRSAPSQWLAPSSRSVWWEKLPFAVLALAAIPVILHAKAGALAAVTGSKLLLGAALCARMSETVPTPEITDEGETG